MDGLTIIMMEYVKQFVGLIKIGLLTDVYVSQDMPIIMVYVQFVHWELSQVMINRNVSVL